MDSRHPKSTASFTGHSIHAMLVPLPIAFYILALIMDVAYWQTSNLTWKHFAEWLLLAGLIGGGLAMIAGAIDFITRRDIRSRPAAWRHTIGNIFVMLLAFVNSLVHARDGWTGVVPTGLALSAATALFMLITGLLDATLVYRRGVRVKQYD
jgi:uncharacterized membrane protein